MDFDHSEIRKWKIWKIYSSIYKYKIYIMLVMVYYNCTEWIYVIIRLYFKIRIKNLSILFLHSSSNFNS